MKISYIKYLLSLLLFGSNGIVASHIALDSYDIVFLRTLIGGTVLALAFALTKGKLSFYKNIKDFLYLAGSGLAMGISWMLLFEGYKQNGVSITTLIYYCGPALVMVASPYIFKEKMTNIKILAFAIVMLGMFLVNGQAISQGELTKGLLFAIGSAITYALMIILNKKAASIKGLENSMLQVLVGFVVVGSFVLSDHPLPIDTIKANIWPILFLGIVNTGLGCYLYFSAIPELPVGSVAILGYLDPVSALVFSAMFLQERLSAIQIIGAFLIIGGAIAGECYKAKVTSPKVPGTNGDTDDVPRT